MKLRILTRYGGVTQAKTVFDGVSKWNDRVQNGNDIFKGVGRQTIIYRVSEALII